MEDKTTMVKIAYPAKVLTWSHDQPDKFLNGNFSNNIYFELSITKPDIFDKSFQFSVKVIMTGTDQFNGEVFKAITFSGFELGYHKDAPTVEFLFGLIDQAAGDFAAIFYEKVQQTNLQYQPILKPKIGLLRASIQVVIDHWDEEAIKFKANGRKRLPSFKNLPTIPPHKSYNGENLTTEQIILRKLETGKAISNEEREIFGGLGEFYEELNKQLILLDYRSFAGDDFLDFKNYIHYAFTASAAVSNEASIAGELFRLVTNQAVTGKNEAITNVRFLSYPSLEIVKKNGKVNRASTWNTTVLYLTESIDTALKEIHPEPSQIVSVSVWGQKKPRTYRHFPIEHDEQAALVNAQVAAGKQALQLLNAQLDPLLARYMHNYFSLLSREYSKTVSPAHHFEYMLSAILSERIFDFSNGNSDFNFDFITYPSVGNNFFTRNIAVRSSVADANFEIVRVIEFEIVKCNYERLPVYRGNAAAITVADIKNYRETTKITADGDIIW